MAGTTMFTPKDIKEILGVSYNTVYSMFRQDGFPSMKIGRRHFITSEAFYKWLELYEGKRFLI